MRIRPASPSEACASGLGSQALHGLSCPRLDPVLERLIGVLGGICLLLEEHYAVPAHRHIELRMTDDAEVNARAFLHHEQGAYVIELTSGLIVWADGVAATIAARVAGVTIPGERTTLLPENIARSGPAGLQARLDDVTQWLPPAQYGFWESVFQSICVNVLAHEASHVLRGHLDLRAGALGLRPEIDELALVRRVSRTTQDTVRRLEFDADTFAARLITHFSLAPPAFMPRWRINTAQENLVVSLLGAGLFSVAIEREEQLRDARASGYPRPLLRFLSMLIEMDRCWRRNHAEDAFFTQIFPAALSVLGELEEIYPEIDLLRNMNDRAIMDATTAEAFALVDELASFERTILENAFDGAGLWPAGHYG